MGLQRVGHDWAPFTFTLKWIGELDFLFKISFIYLAMLGLSCGLWDLWSSLPRAGLLVAVCKRTSSCSMWEHWPLVKYREVSGTHQGTDSSEMHYEMLMVLQRIADLHSNMQMNTLFPLAQTGIWLVLRKGLPWPVTSLINSQGWLLSIIRNIFLILTLLYK